MVLQIVSGTKLEFGNVWYFGKEQRRNVGDCIQMFHISQWGECLTYGMVTSNSKFYIETKLNIVTFY